MNSIMEKFERWLDKPWTNRSYCKALGVSAICSVIIWALTMLYLFWDRVTGFFQDVVGHFRR